MIFSQWQPDGGYKYFETKQRHAIGDDVPAVHMPPISGNLGVPAQDVGYEIPSDAKFIGEGKEPIGIMAPMSREGFSQLSGSSLTKQDKTVFLFVFLAFSVAAVANWKDLKHARSRH